MFECVFIYRACLFPWLPTSYVFGNGSVLAVGVWAIAQRDSIDAVLLVGVIFFHPRASFSDHEGLKLLILFSADDRWEIYTFMIFESF